jgi:hypothetical protein
MFGTCSNYITLRLLGEEPYGNNGALAKGRAWILSHGGATFIPQWGKIWLSVFFAIHTRLSVFFATHTCILRLVLKNKN